MKIVALFVQSLLWLSVAFSPTLLGLIVGVFVKFNFSGQLSDLAIPTFTLIGFILGGFWAENIRKTIGLSAFLGRLIGHRDIDGAPR
ncbi:hypothetical protein [Shewanella youngdeokensis]|uniref:Uncharacterized protein n=1 Tax=Shewanella youngdeokensis TaxID=2999068 RepID=A0ABZ0JZT6_9GAMM|nr:hypothetical protein RGE70_03065 [Shewanella sp. DAU334]